MNDKDLKNWYIANDEIYTASLELTQNCNFSCKHCYCSEKNISPLPFESWKIIIDKLFNAGILYLSFTGGEILTHKDFEKIYVYAKEKGFLVTLLTNGSLINEKLVELFKELPPKSISITLYGTNEKEYADFTGNGENFKKVETALNLLKENGVNFALRTLATKTFYNSLLAGDFDKFAEKFNVPFRFDPIIFPKISGDKKPLEEILSVAEIIELEKNNSKRNSAWRKIINEHAPFVWKCRAGINSLSIDHKGAASICGLYRKNSISLLENEPDTVRKHLRQIHEIHAQIVAENSCAKCKARYICKWCPAYSQIYNGCETAEVDFFCELSKARLKNFTAS